MGLPIHHIHLSLLRYLFQHDAAQEVGVFLIPRSGGIDVAEQLPRLLGRPSTGALAERDSEQVVVAEDLLQRVLRGLDHVARHSRNTRIAPSPQWLMTFTAIWPDLSFAKGRLSVR